VKVQESFVIAQAPERLWEFFEQVDKVAGCVPGVESVEIIDDENSKVRVTQAVGPMTATFELKMRITERVPQESMQFTAIGRAVKGAAGNIRTTNTVRLAPVEDGTRVDLESELAIGGVMGSLGQKVVAKQAGQVTKQFAAALERSLNGDAPPAAAAAPAAAPGAPSASANGAAPAAPAAPAAAALPAQSPDGKQKRQVALTGLSVVGAFALLRLLLGRRSR
jgi:hypothetical protein